MRPVKLSISGLNSFIEEQTIDFEKLSSAGLFGIFGPTGSGKSTIVDAITMALYGELSRFDNDKKSKQCINAACDKMSVCFEFEICGENGYTRYGAFRSYKRKKDKNMETLLCRFYKIEGEDTIILADKASKMKEEIINLIGLNYDDFSRSVVLPQGKFSDFLLLGNKERRDMLERIFGLEEYGENLNRKIRLAANQCKNHLAVTEKSLEFYGDLNKEKIEKAQESLAEAEKDLEKLKTRLEELTKEHRFLLQKKELQIRIRNNEENLKQQKDLLQKVRLEEEKAALLYESAYNIKKERYPLLIQRDTQLGQAVELCKEAEQLERQRIQLLEGYTSKKEQLSKLLKKIEEIAGVTVSLKNELLKKTEEKKKTDLNPEYRQGIQEAYSIWRQEKDEERKRASLYERLKTVQTSLANGKTELAHRKKRLQDLKEGLGARLTKADALQRKGRKELEAYEEQLRQINIENMAADLAQNLREGRPCPVCGSSEHPLKASGVKTEADSLRKKMEFIQKENQALEIGLLALVKNLAASGENMTIRQEELDPNELKAGGLIPEMEHMAKEYNRILHEVSGIGQSISKDETLLRDLEKEKSEVEEEKKKREGLLRQYGHTLNIQDIEGAYKEMLRWDKERSLLEKQELKLRLSLDEKEKEQELYKKEQSEMAVALQELKTRGLEKKEALEGCRQKIKALVGDDAKIEAPEQQKEVRKEIELILQREEKLKKDFDAVSQRSKSIFNEVSALEKQGETLEDLWREANAKLPLTDNEDLNEKEAAAKEALIACQDKISEKLSLGAVLKERICKMTEDLEEFDKLHREKKELNRRLDMLTDLAGLFEGNRFVEFVAKKQLSYIAADASVRLKEMSNGRYALELDGTDFIMRDDGCGGIRRSPRTLSGGETFTVSLCLALALSAKIQLKSAAPLEFFFLDEGFGTLDSSLLDVVMQALERLPSEKMKVGLISHVEELKNRLPLKLELVPADQGLHGTIISR